MPSSPSLHDLCELGSEQLIQTEYLAAEATLARAEAQAWDARDWDTLARLYMPLQEARRQRRQRCGEGVVALDLVAQGPHDDLDGRRVIDNFPHGQLLVAGWRSIEPAVRVRRLAAEHGLYVETFLGAVFPVGAGQTAVVIVPTEDAELPGGAFDSLEALMRALPENSLVGNSEGGGAGVIVRGQRKGTPETFGEVMALWERLHAPFLAAADAEPDRVRQIERYRFATQVDYACELAHQKLSNGAHQLARERVWGADKVSVHRLQADHAGVCSGGLPMPFNLGYGRGRSGGGFNMRWIIAIVIAGFGLVTYLMRTQVNPVTGEKQRVALTVDQEKALGLQSAPQMVEQMNARIVDPARDPRAALVRDVGMKLVKASDAARSPYVDTFNFHLLDDELVNAFALPGGQIFITTTLFDQLENEAQLAGVLGHEIGHVIHRHSAEHMATGQLGQTIVGAVAVGASGEDGGGRMAAAAAAMANNMLQLKYGRGDETESDRTGIDYMADAGYDPREMLGVMQVLKKASGGRGGMEWMQSHPLPDTRLKDIEQTVNASFKPDQLAKLTKGRPLTDAGVRTAGERERERW